MQADFSPLTDAITTAILEMAIIGFSILIPLAILGIIFERIVNKFIDKKRRK